MKIKLLNELTEIVSELSTSDKIFKDFSTVNELDSFREELSKENLSSFEYLSDTDEIIGKYENYILVNTEYTVKDDVYNAIFTIRQLSDTEIRLDALESSQASQDNAIDELNSKLDATTEA